MAPEGGEIDELLSSRTNSSYPRDLLRRFSGDAGDGTPAAEVVGGGVGEIELALSLGGCYAEPKDKRLVRASSMTLSMFSGERIDFPAVTTPPTRTCSLPTETEEERRKRKELECLKRMEAKRKRSVRRAAAAANINLKEDILDENLVNKAGNGVVVPAVVAKWAAPTGGRGGARPASQGSIGSQGSSSLEVSDFESRPVQRNLTGVDVSGLGNCAEVRSPATLPSAADRTNHRALAASPKQVIGKPANLSTEGDEPSRKKSCTLGKLNGMKEMEKNILEEMPCVSTKGDGPNGRRIEGFLYKYRSGEEVRIMCVCHGSFLTPAEFVKHAGGGDVAHPLRHIVVNPTPSAFL